MLSTDKIRGAVAIALPQMSRLPVIDPNGSYTFSNYFELGIAINELTNERYGSFAR